MNNITQDTLKTGEVLESIKDHSTLDPKIVDTENYTECEAVKIRCELKNTKRNPAYTWVNIPNKMFNAKYIYLGEKTAFKDALHLNYLHDIGTGYLIVPIIMLKRTGQRIIDTRKIPDNNTVNNILRKTIPVYERRALYNKLKHTSNSIKGMPHKLRLKWFIEPKNTTKEFLAEVIHNINPHQGLSCPHCGAFFDKTAIKIAGYSRAGKVFIRCNICGIKSFISICSPKVIDTIEDPFILVRCK